VFVASRELAACEEVAAGIRASGGAATACAVDVADSASIDALVASVLAQIPRLHALVSNAAIAWAAPTLDFMLEAWDRSFATNVRGPFWLARQAARHMREHGAVRLLPDGLVISLAGPSGELRSPIQPAQRCP
jgi:NAD(P)-dependent dehydrogenase (short-subunit alcohol dehydrogenase family)